MANNHWRCTTKAMSSTICATSGAIKAKRCIDCKRAAEEDILVCEVARRDGEVSRGDEETSGEETLCDDACLDTCRCKACL
ncbi:hypothetical protein D2E26_0431 [Bifidobacterium dolichotidis]|uniref:Uncharacterized protein n=1 Tax=Bifidobacterium dolichotidis TaxID=2306976 RepID=A0A430FSM2_9BIFI|nr:hypothetical protein D2E26_0431 [Bifidobacterium dolichotidis]